MGILGVAVALNITYTSNYLVQEFFVLVYKKNEFLPYSAPLFQK
jgi:hypothetical protein